MSNLKRFDMAETLDEIAEEISNTINEMGTANQEMQSDAILLEEQKDALHTALSYCTREEAETWLHGHLHYLQTICGGEYGGFWECQALLTVFQDALQRLRKEDRQE